MKKIVLILLFIELTATISNAQTEGYFLDSIITKNFKNVNVSKHINKIDSLGRIVKYFTYKWDTVSNAWKIDIMEQSNFIKKFYPSGKLKEVIQTYPNQYVEVYYDDKGNDTLHILNYPYQNISIKQIRHYNNNNNIIENSNYIYDTVSDSWIGSMNGRILYKYDEKNNIIEKNTYKWISDWILIQTNIFIYENEYTTETVNYFKDGVFMPKITRIYITKDSINLKNINGILKYTYNYQGELVKGNLVFQNKDANNEIIYLEEYDANGNLILNVKYIWNNQNAQWNEIEKIISNYDSLGVLKNELTYSYDVINKKWIDSLKFEIKEDIYGNNSRIMYEYNKTTKFWQIQSGFKTLIKQDSQFNIIESLSYNWDTNLTTWILEPMASYKYDINYNLDSSISKKITFQRDYNKLDTVWRQKNKIEYIYNKTTQIQNFFTWDTNLLQWIQTNKNTIVFNSFGAEQLVESFNWDCTSNSWIGSVKREYEFDSNGNKILKNIYDWDIDSLDWKLNTISYYYYSPVEIDTFNISNSEILVLHGKSTSIIINHKNLLQYVNFNFYDYFKFPKWLYVRYYNINNDSTLIIFSCLNNKNNEVEIPFYLISDNLRNFEYYTLNQKIIVKQLESTITKIPITSDKKLYIYPNPVTSYFKIGNNYKGKVEVYNLQGTLVYNNTITENQAISVLGWAKGQYLVKIETSNGKLIEKVIVE